MSIKNEAKNVFVVVLIAIILIIAINAYNLFESKYSRKINPEAIVVIGDIQLDAFEYNSREIVDKDELIITKAVEVISAQEEHLSFEEVYTKIKDLKYYDLPPLYWDELSEDQKRISFQVWETYMKELIRQCAGNEIIKFTKEEIQRCIELKEREIQEKRQLLF